VELLIRDDRALETGGLRAGSRSGSQSVESCWATANIGERIDRLLSGICAGRLR
jgi:hypothetical protein